MSRDQEAEVVIVGAGPVGLWTACELKRRGIHVLVLEKLQTRSPHSRALTLHPRSVEVLAMRDLTDQVFAEGVKTPNGHFGLLENLIDFTVLDTPFNFTLRITQVRTEEVMEQHARNLGVEIRRNHAVTAVTHDEEGARVAVDGPDGAYSVACKYVVGADGAGSIVRKQIGVEFPGTDATTYGFLGDVFLDNPPEAFRFVKTGEHGGLMAGPLPEGCYRIAGYTPYQKGTKPPSFEEFREFVRKIAGTDFGMRDPVWLSAYGNATKQVSQYRVGRVLLAGDAAHIHFPAGGVGLNIGVQDAMNLGWKLAAEIKGHAPEGLLDSYHHERHPVGQALLNSTLAQTALITAFTPEGLALRALLNGLMVRHKVVREDLANRVAALDVVYSPADTAAHSLTGARAPDLKIETATGTQHLFDVLHPAAPVLLDLAGGDLKESASLARRLGMEAVAGRLAEDIRPAWSPVKAALIRPDGHVAWASEEADPEVRDRLAIVALALLDNRASSNVAVAADV